MVDVLLPARAGVSIRKCGISRSTEHQVIRLQRLGLEIPRTSNLQRHSEGFRVPTPKNKRLILQAAEVGLDLDVQAGPVGAAALLEGQDAFFEILGGPLLRVHLNGIFDLLVQPALGMF